ncbi:leishmanolysin family protein, putative [Ichthyophthirius multifiliis]|uniref:Leishmanolysin family protein, putative n=1 Tax=Ichthyophthirius multifiliis TaxID=5932 RepID=G0R5H6_ICHMU|nr:leishmanolysin family protein, putative [Ichthyophthirius multifiliis]EGR27277.1 leishmanolysin family protein, putative [Ichthyophthirius multifiliis]|eukprot:XP_004024161.1 leishmanolysin family protein, putative [Ichthyophthirius multifiliis]
MMKILLIAIIINIKQIYAIACDHDHDDDIKKFHKEFEKEYYKHVHKDQPRNLQTGTPQPYRITADYSPIDLVSPVTITTEQKNYLITLVETTKIYFANLIKVIPKSGNNKFPSGWSTTCINVAVPSADQTIGIPNSDLHLYITYQNNPTSTVLASASFCAIDSIFQRPNFGRIQFNIGQMPATSMTLFRFKSRIETTVHETLHVLGFSGFAMQYWIDPNTKVPYGSTGVTKITSTQTIRTFSTNIVSSPNILKTSRKYFSCPTLLGMQLENGGGSGTAGSHWEKTLLSNEMMNGESVPTDAALSIFTVSLLRDTGFFAEINENFASNIYWGKNKGCDYVNNACKGIYRYQEFVDGNTVKTCTFEYQGSGIGANPVTLDTCFYIMPYSNKLCTNPDNNLLTVNKYVNDRYEFFGYQSRCLNSTASTGLYGFTDSMRCHDVTCAPDYSYVTIKLSQLNKSIQCTKEKQVIQVDPLDATKGAITCPDSFQYFCDFQPLCKNFCSQKGVCVKGFCICIPGQSGEDCNIPCPKYSENGVCVNACSAGKFAGIDNTCRPTCFNGFYKNNGVCSQCHSSCSRCTGPLATQCTGCQYLTYLDGTSCVETCPSNKIPNEQTKLCESCSTGCSVCTSSTTCSQCDASLNYVLSNGICVKNMICDPSCLACSGTATYCTKCPSPLFLDKVLAKCVVSTSCPSTTFANTTNQECTNCTLTGCTKCLNSSTCSTCAVGYRLVGSVCSNCTSPCLTCQSTSSTSCLSCELITQFLNGTSCVTTCPVGTYPDTFTKLCKACSLTGCSACSSATVCTTCASGYTLSSNNCVIPSLCTSPCKTCYSTDKTMCTSCISGYYLFYQYCFTTCPQETYLETATGICQWCQYGCLKCVNDTICTICDTSYGWQLYNNYCIEATECYAPCKTCVSYKPTTCTACQTGYVNIYLLFHIFILIFSICLLINVQHNALMEQSQLQVFADVHYFNKKQQYIFIKDFYFTLQYNIKLIFFYKLNQYFNILKIFIQILINNFIYYNIIILIYIFFNKQKKLNQKSKNFNMHTQIQILKY